MSAPSEKRHPASRAASPAPSAASVGTRRSAKGSVDAHDDSSHGATTTDDDRDAAQKDGDTGPAAALTAALPDHHESSSHSALPPHMLQEAGMLLSSAGGSNTPSPVSILSPQPSKPGSVRSVSRPDSPGASSVTFVDPAAGTSSSLHPASRSSLRPSSSSSTRSPSSEPRPSADSSSTDISGLRSVLHRTSIDSGDDSHPRPVSAHTAPASSSRSRKAKTRIVSEGEKLMSSTRYERKVGFDTMPDADETNSGSFSFTLQLKSHGYKKTRLSRTFMCCVDDNSYSERALEWLMDSLVEDGDEVVALRVLEGEAEEIDQAAAREDARELLASIVQLNEEVRQHLAENAAAERGVNVVVSSPGQIDSSLQEQQDRKPTVTPGERRINVIVEFVAGKVEDTILRLIHMYRPCSLSVGTRGRTVSAFHKMLGGGFVGSTSRDILASSPVPVVVIRPEAKVQKHLSKRSNNPKRPRSYHELVAKVPEAQLPMSLSGRGGPSKSAELARK